MFPLPYLALFALIAVVTAFSGGWHYGAKQAAVACEQERQALVAEEAAKQSELRAAMAEAENRAATARAKEVIRWKTINKEVERVVKEPVYTSIDCRLTDDGVRLWNIAANVVRVADSAVQTATVPDQSASPQAGGYLGRLVHGGSQQR